MRRSIAAISLALLACTTPTKKVCNFTNADEQLVIYNNILTELVEEHMHGWYLGEVKEQLMKENYGEGDDFDSAAMNADIVRMHNEVFNNPSKFCTLYLDTVNRRWHAAAPPAPDEDFSYKSLILEYTDNPLGGLDSLSTLQTRYTPQEFGLCIARLDYLPEDANDAACSIGQVRLSRLILNANHDEGLVLYDWHCGPLCGHSGIVRIAKGPTRWKIDGFEYWTVY